MTIRFLKLSLASPESIRSWTERTLSNGNKVGKILKGDLIDYKNGLPIRDGLNCERIFGPVVSFTCSCGRFKCFETRGIHIVHDYGNPTRSDHLTSSLQKFQNSAITEKKNSELSLSNSYINFSNKFPYRTPKNFQFFEPQKIENSLGSYNKIWSFFGARHIDIIKIHQLLGFSDKIACNFIGEPSLPSSIKNGRRKLGKEKNLIFSIPSFETWYSTGRTISFSCSTSLFLINNKKNNFLQGSPCRQAPEFAEWGAPQKKTTSPFSLLGFHPLIFLDG